MFELSPPTTKGGTWTEKVLHNFAGGTDGANPNGGLVLDGKGNVYGTTYTGGYNCPHNSGQGCGTVFKLDPPTTNGSAWIEAVLHRFKQDTSDGGNPMAGLWLDGAGNLYGTTLNGGPGQYGTVFSLSRPAKGSGPWVETVLHGFNDDQQGANPESGLVFDARASLVFDRAGNLYSTSPFGGTGRGCGSGACGTVYEVLP